jgi:hypothetical protein
MFGSRPRPGFAARIAFIGIALFAVSAGPAFGRAFMAEEQGYVSSGGQGTITVKGSTTARTSRANSLTAVGRRVRPAKGARAGTKKF